MAHVRIHCVHSCAGVYLSLKGVVYTNDSSVIPITEIGETTEASNTGLQCITDRRPCCAAPGTRTGVWLFPDGTLVPLQSSATTFYRNRGDDGTVNLNRLNTGVMMPTGLFCCEVPGALNIIHRLCANVGELDINLYVIVINQLPRFVCNNNIIEAQFPRTMPEG